MNIATTKIKRDIGYLTENKLLEGQLLSFLPGDTFREHFVSRLKSSADNYWQTMSEMRAVHVFHNILGVPVADIETKTVGDKSVDFVCGWNNEKVFVEVKGFRPEDHEIARRGGSLGNDEEKIDRALSRSQDKFLNNACNIVVIADEDTIKPPLFMNPLADLEGTPEIYLNSPNYSKTSSVMVLGGLYDGEMFKYKVWHNANPQRALPKDLISKLDQNKSNAKWPWQN